MYKCSQGFVCKSVFVCVCLLVCSNPHTHIYFTNRSRPEQTYFLYFYLTTYMVFFRAKEFPVCRCLRMFVTFFHSPINHQICLKWSPDMDESRCTCTPCLQFLRCQFHMSTNVNAFKYNRKTGISDFPCHCQRTNSFFLLNKVDNSSFHD